MEFKLHVDRRPRMAGGLAVARWTDVYGSPLYSYTIPDGRLTLTDEEELAGDVAAQEELRSRARG